MGRLLVLCGVLTLATPALAQAAPAVRANDDAKRLVLDNGLVGLTIDKATGFVTSLRARADGRDMELGGGPRTMYLDYYERRGTQLTDVHPFQRDLIRLAGNSDDAAEAVIGCEARPDFPFHMELHLSGAAAYRSGGQDSLYQVARVPFDAGLIHAGANEIRLALTGAVPFADPDEARPGTIGGVLYDAVRLEVEPD